MDTYLEDLERSRAVAKERYAAALRAVQAAKAEVDRMDGLIRDEHEAAAREQQTTTR